MDSLLQNDIVAQKGESFSQGSCKVLGVKFFPLVSLLTLEISDIS